MNTWFECKVKSIKVDENGYERKVTDNYLVDAVSYTDAEARITLKAAEVSRGDFQVKSIKQSNIADVFDDLDGESYFKVKVSFLVIDEEKGKTKKVNTYMLIAADDIEEALKRIDAPLSEMLTGYIIGAVSLSTISKVFRYFEVGE